jgi:mono/diheme cytochrome c family protein
MGSQFGSTRPRLPFRFHSRAVEVSTRGVEPLAVRPVGLKALQWSAMLPRMNNPSEVRTSRVRPLAVIATLFTIATIGNAVLVGCGGKSQDQSQTQSPSTSATSGSSGTEASGSTATTGGASDVDAGKKIYLDRCALCHGASGKGDGTAAAGLNPKPRNHTDGSYMNGRTNDQLIEVIRNGKGAMPAWGAILSDAEVHSVLKYVRTLAQPAYTGPLP